MATKNYDDLDYGDETRRHGDYVGLPHDQDSGGNNDVREGEAVAVDANGNIAKADIDGAGAAIGVLFTYQYYTDNTGGQKVDQSRDATVKTSGTVKARVGSGVAAGDHLAAPATATSGTAGVLDASSSSEDSNFVALSDAKQDDLDDGTTAYYAEVLLL